MPSTSTLLLDSPELQKMGILEKDEHISMYKTSHHGKFYTLTIIHGSHEDSRYVVDQELEIIRDLDHPNIVKCYEISYRKDEIHVLSEFFSSKSLSGRHVADEFSLSNLTRQVLLALSYLHKRGIVHGGIKPSRFFMDNKMGCAKITYFGRLLEANPTPDNRINALGDIQSLGLSILELYLGSCAHKKTWLEKVELPSGASAGLKDFVTTCLTKHPAEMLTAQQLLQHPFTLRNTIDGAQLQGHSLRGNEEVEPPSSTSTFISSSTRLMRTTEMKLAEESEVHLPPSSNGRENMASVLDGKQSIRGTKRWMSDHSFMVQRCAKRKKLKTKEANVSDMSKELTVVVNNKNDSSSSSSDTKERINEFEDLHFEGVPENAKSCLLYCSLFPLDFEFDEDTLIQLWIAEGLIKSEDTREFENDGQACFDILAKEEFILPSSYDTVQGMHKYKLNESKAAASCWYTKGGFSRSGYQRIADQIGAVSDRSLHLSLDMNFMKEMDSSTLEILGSHKQLRTLLLLSSEYGSSVNQIPRSLFISLRNLCTLDLSRTHISELPATVGCLECLQYLNLSYTPIKHLPESIDSLHSLQTLQLRSCFALRALPEGMSKLVNLRHLDLDIVRQLMSMPKGMGNLINLRTLKAFIVGKGDGHRIGELMNLNNITGSVCISRLENVVKLEEAVKAGLSTKRYINKLELRWGGGEGGEGLAVPDEEEILGCLQPHYGLKELQIQFYKGSTFPSWIGDPCFNSIVKITIYRCTECPLLPCLGNLPVLKCLKIIGLNGVKQLNSLFGQTCYGTTTRVECAFPKLENLTLENMSNLEELNGAENGDLPCLIHVYIRYCPKLIDLSLLSHLKKLKNLEISHCNQLLCLPEVSFPPSVQSLCICGCPSLKQRYLKNGGQGWSKIAHIPKIWIDYEQISCI